MLIYVLPFLLALTSQTIGYFNILKTFDIDHQEKKVILIGDDHATHSIESSQCNIISALLNEGVLKKTALLLEHSEAYFEEEEASFKIVEKFNPGSKPVLLQELGRMTHKKDNFNNISVIWGDSRTTTIQEISQLPCLKRHSFTAYVDQPQPQSLGHCGYVKEKC
jgi:hypothetical protein